jgi:hypothetical protein
MYSVHDTRCRVGCPIRISTDQRLLAAPRGFSQRATSFIASWCQGIHRMPFLYSISRLGLLRPRLTMHRNHPQGMKDSSWKYLCFPRTHNSFRTATAPIAYATATGSIPDKLFTAPLNPRCPTVGALLSRATLPVRQVGRTTGSQTLRRSGSDHTRPETHQNLIHISKEQTRLVTAASSARSHDPGRFRPGT